MEGKQWLAAAALTLGVLALPNWASAQLGLGANALGGDSLGAIAQIQRMKLEIDAQTALAKAKAELQKYEEKPAVQQVAAMPSVHAVQGTPDRLLAVFGTPVTGLRYVSRGQTIDGFSVSDVTPRAVVLTKDGQTYRLPVGASSTQPTGAAPLPAAAPLRSPSLASRP